MISLSLLFFVGFPLLCCAYIRTQQQRTGILPVPFREREIRWTACSKYTRGYRRSKKSDWSAQSKANMARLSSDIFPFVADYMRLVILLTDSFFSFFS